MEETYNNSYTVYVRYVRRGNNLNDYLLFTKPRVKGDKFMRLLNGVVTYHTLERRCARLYKCTDGLYIGRSEVCLTYLGEVHRGQIHSANSNRSRIVIGPSVSVNKRKAVISDCFTVNRQFYCTINSKHQMLIHFTVPRTLNFDLSSVSLDEINNLITLCQVNHSPTFSTFTPQSTYPSANPEGMQKLLRL